MTFTCSARLTVHGSSEIDLDGTTIRYSVKRSPRARHARLEIKPESGLTIIVPQGYPLSLVPEIIVDKKRWVRAKLELFRRGKHEYPDDNRHTHYLGRTLIVTTRVDPNARESVSLEADELLISAKTISNAPRCLEKWQKKQAERLIKEMAQKHGSGTGLTYATLRIRSARTRWGSCSPRGSLSFNWKLVMAPIPVIEYVVIHELCHLKEMNHSKAFWTLVEQHCPDWRTQRRWLKANESALSI